MGKNKGGFYAVKEGRQKGIFSTWSECEEQVKGFSGAKFQKFPTRQEAQNFVDGVKSSSTSTVGSSSSSAPTPAFIQAQSPTAIGKRKREEVEVKLTSEDSSLPAGRKIINVYTDGAASNNGRHGAQAGWGVHFPDHPELDESGRISGAEQTNNRAELMAIIRGIQLNPNPNAQLRIHTDSQYSINCLTKWHQKWRKNQWKRTKTEDVKNRDLIRLCLNEMQKCDFKPILIYVKGHSTNIGNNEADRLAVLGATLPEIPKDQWKDLEPPPSDDETSTDLREKATNSWERYGFKRMEAEKRAGGKKD